MWDDCRPGFQGISQAILDLFEFVRSGVVLQVEDGSVTF
jgi:hypothetical protein